MHCRRPLISASAVAVAAVALLAAGCGGRGSKGRQVAQLGSNTTQIHFSRCMRSHGVLNFPDPSSGGVIPKESLQRLEISSSRFQAARNACQHLLPGGGSGPSAAQVQHDRAQALSYSQCVRHHGVPNFPDPAGSGRIPDPATVGIDQDSQKFEAANQICGEYRPPYIPSNAAYNSWARTHPAVPTTAGTNQDASGQ